MNLTFFYNNQRININCVKITSYFNKAVGLMFKSYSKAKISVFIFNPARKISLTTFFCFFPMLILFFKDKKLVNFSVVKTFKSNIPSDFEVDTIVEIPLNNQEFEKLKEINDERSMVKELFNLDKIKTSSETKPLNTSSS